MAPPTHRALAARQSRGPQAVAKAYVFAERRVRRVGIDYHVEVERHFYSVSYRFARREVEVRIAGRTVEIIAKGERIAVDMQSSGNGKHTTAAD
jgi:transposase